MRLSQRVDHWTAAFAAAIGVTLPDCTSDHSADSPADNGALVDAGHEGTSASPDAWTEAGPDVADASSDASDVGWPSCTNPRDIGDGVTTGYVQCEEGYLHRTDARECVVNIDPDAGFPESSDATPHFCYTNADCRERPYGYCAPPQWLGDLSYHCEYGCATDADCSGERVCLCGPTVGTCILADCKTDADCAEGFCADYGTVCQTTRAGLACQSHYDQCLVPADCPSTTACEFGDPGRQQPLLYRACATGVCGRPFLVDGTPRTGAVAARADWVSHAPAIDAALDARARAELALYYEQLALLEHASIAAFARFTLQLLALGAPPELIDGSQRAALDEAEHARLCFSLASRYRGEACGPGPIDVAGALNDLDAATTLTTTILEGCIGETVAALEAGEAAAHATDPLVKGAFEQIAEDETKHAALAWRVVRWLVACHPQLAVLALRTFQSEMHRAEPSLHGREPPALSAHGYVGPGMRAKIRRAALQRAVGPLVQSLFAPQCAERAAARSSSLRT